MPNGKSHGRGKSVPDKMIVLIVIGVYLLGWFVAYQGAGLFDRLVNPEGRMNSYAFNAFFALGSWVSVLSLILVGGGCVLVSIIHNNLFTFLEKIQIFKIKK